MAYISERCHTEDMDDVSKYLGAVQRRVVEREHEGQRCFAVQATRTYDTDIDDLWDALTNRERLPRWFLPVEGELKLGGRYQLKGNAGGTITRCERPKLLALTWEFGPAVSWVSAQLHDEGERTRLELEHLVPDNEHFRTWGPGAVGVGWELGLNGLLRYLSGRPFDPAEGEAFATSPEGKRLVQGSSDGWRDAYIAAGAEPTNAREIAAATTRFYTGG